MKTVSTNPSRNYEVIGEVEVSTEQEIKDAVARGRQTQTVWQGMSVADRGNALASFFSTNSPFGGYKKSGNSYTRGQAGFQEVTKIKLISEEK